jgi:hypothetical protein
MRDPDQVRYVKKKLKHKRWGIQKWNPHLQRWRTVDWYETEKARNQAYENMLNKTTILTGTIHDQPIRKAKR